MRPTLFILALLSLSFHNSEAQHYADTASWKPYQKPSLEVHRRMGAIKIDGDISDEGWKNASHISQFTGALPEPNSAPIVQTDAYITYDENYLYIAMAAADPDPGAIRSSLRQRDDIWNEDFMGIILDTYGDANTAYEIYVNPRGVQGDLIWTATSEDASYDLIYTAESQITPAGWQMEMRIPYHSLRFPTKPVQDWHITFWRNYPREVDYKFSWSPMNFFEPCAFCQLGILTGIENIQSGGALDLLPSLAAIESAGTDSIGLPLTNSGVRIKPSLDVRYSPATNTTLEVTLNPDFSQVEADASQVDVNSTFALSFPERRPFFEEGTELFNMLLNALYTRSINDPLVAAKGTYRLGNTRVAYLGAYDRNSPVIIPLEERSIFSNAGKSFSNVVRALDAIGDDTYLGALLTDRRYDGDGSNTVFGLDGRVLLFENVEMYGQGLASYTREQFDTTTPVLSVPFDNGKYTTTFDGEHYSGYDYYMALDRNTRNLDLHFDYSSVSPAFRSGNGFITRNDFRGTSSLVQYKQPFEHSFLVQATPGLVLAEDWNFDGDVKFKGLRGFIDLSLKGQTVFHAHYRSYLERFRQIDFPRMHQWDFNVSSRFSPSIGVGGDVTLGREIARTISIPRSGAYYNLSAWTEFKPFGGLLIEPNYVYSRLDSDEGGQYYEGSIYHIRFTYQFTRELSVRLVTEYNTFAGSFYVDPLVTYRLNPFSSFYIGSTHNFTQLESGMPFLPSERQFFAKIQYLLET